jgi:GR25 family glycosyltransferase involved in LPS biosynthesis
MRENGAEGCLLSHAGVASQLKAPYVVLEDDAVPTEAANSATEVVAAVHACIKENLYDIIYLGGLPLDSKATSLPGIYEGKCWTTYAMIVGPRAAQFLRTASYNGVPIDVQLARQNLKSAFVDPPLFRQAITHSEIGKSAFTKSVLFAHVLGYATPVWRWTIIHFNLVLCLIFACLLVALKRLNASF